MFVEQQNTKKDLVNPFLKRINFGFELLFFHFGIGGYVVAILYRTMMDDALFLGFVPGTLPEEFFDALPDEELDAWGL